MNECGTDAFSRHLRGFESLQPLLFTRCFWDTKLIEFARSVLILGEDIYDAIESSRILTFPVPM